MAEMKLNEKLSQVWDQLVSRIENNPGVWDNPWFMTKSGASVRPVNFSTGRGYSGFNIFSLEIARLSQGFNSNKWLTFNQCAALKGYVQKGSKGSSIIVFSPPKFKEELNDKGDLKKVMERPAFFGSSYVFNIEQTTLTDDTVKLPENNLMTVDQCEQMITKTGAIIHERISDKAYYSPVSDEIVLPVLKQFKTTEGYYGTKFHELVHWTGHERRLNRLSKTALFGTEEYSREELIAEIGSVFLKTSTGINDNFDNASAYIKNWWTVIKEDKGSLIEACAKAQKAHDYILSGGPNHE